MERLAAVAVCCVTGLALFLSLKPPPQADASPVVAGVATVSAPIVSPAPTETFDELPGAGVLQPPAVAPAVTLPAPRTPAGAGFVSTGDCAAGNCAPARAVAAPRQYQRRRLEPFGGRFRRR